MNNTTPGPWTVFQARYSSQIQIRDEAEEIIIAAVPDKGNPQRARADADLLAAAPDLLATIIQVRDSLRGLVTVPPDTCKYEIAWLNAAIAKAEGQV